MEHLLRLAMPAMNCSCPLPKTLLLRLTIPAKDLILVPVEDAPVRTGHASYAFETSHGGYGLFLECLPTIYHIEIEKCGPPLPDPCGQLNQQSQLLP